MNHARTVHRRERPADAGRWLDRLAARLVLNQFDRLQWGRLILDETDRRCVFGPPGAPSGVRVIVHDPSFFADVAFGGSVGACEAYMRGSWSCDDLTGLCRLLLRNRAVLDGMDSGIGGLAAPLQKTMHWLNRNTRRGSRRNIAAHYDLGNEFFRVWLDPTLMYSAAIFEHPEATLEQASKAKLERICRKLQLSSHDHVIEIGTGWGGFAIHAARHYGCRVTTTTISREQHALATERVAEAGLEDRITLLCEDYRDLEGQYDKLVSIEMIEAVGHRYYDEFFAKCSTLLREDGMMLLQAITIADQRYPSAVRSVDFIQRYIFPGSCLPSVAVMTDALARVTDLRLFNLEDIGPHYARTLRRWRERFLARLDEVRALGYSQHFIRMWELYLCYCEAGFLERALGDVQMLLVKPANQRDPYLPG